MSQSNEEEIKESNPEPSIGKGKTTTPPPTPGLQEFSETIDSFSFENTSPPQLAITKPNTPEKRPRFKQIKEIFSTKKHRTRIVGNEKPSGSTDKINSTSNIQPGFLRSGKLFKRRSNSFSEFTHSEPTNKPEFSGPTHPTVETPLTMSVDICKINTLVCTGIPILSGESGPNLINEVNTFLKCCVHTIACLTSEETKTFLQLIPIRFRDRASVLLEGEYKDLKELETLVRTKLINTKPYQTLVNELRLLRQVPGESLVSFGNRVKNLYKECCTSNQERYVGEAAQAIEADLEETAIYTFKIGIINPNHKFFLLQSEEKQLPALLEKARKLEEAEQLMTLNPPQLNLYQPTGSLPVNNPMNSFKPQAAPFHPSRNYSQPNQYQSNQQQPHKNPPRPQRNFNHYPLHCGFCNKPNHTYADCRTRKNTPFCVKCKVYGHHVSNCVNKTPSPPRAPPVQVHTLHNRNITQGGQTRCEFCQRLGHTLQACRTKKQWDLRTESKVSPQNQVRQQPENSNRAAIPQRQ